MFEISIWCTSSVTMIYWNTDLSYENWKPFYFLFGKTKNKTDVSVNQIIMIFKSNSKGFRFVFLKKSYFYMKLKVTINNSKIWSDPSFPLLNVISLFMNDSPKKTCFKYFSMTLWPWNRWTIAVKKGNKVYLKLVRVNAQFIFESKWWEMLAKINNLLETRGSIIN